MNKIRELVSNNFKIGGLSEQLHFAFNALETGNSESYSQAAENIKRAVAKGAYKDMAIVNFKDFIKAIFRDLKTEITEKDVETLLSFEMKQRSVVGDNSTVKTEKLMELVVRPKYKSGGLSYFSIIVESVK